MAIDTVTNLPISQSGSDSTVQRNAAPLVNSASAAVPESRQQAVAAVDVQAAISQLKDYLANSNRAIEYRTDGATGMTIVTVSDPETGDVIRQIPNEEVLRLAQVLNDSTAKGANALLHLTA